MRVAAARNTGSCDERSLGYEHSRRKSCAISGSDVVRITISVGLAVLGDIGTEAEDLLDRADARLIKAKQGGRSCVVGPAGQPRTTAALLRTSGEQEEEPQVS